MKKIKIALVGIGNCASNLVQGIEYYKRNPTVKNGLVHRKMGDYDISDIEIVAAFDIAEGKIGKDLSEAIYAKPNCTKKIVNLSDTGVIVQKGPVLDGWDKHFRKHVIISDKPEVDIKKVLVQNEVDIMVIMLPTGSTEACYEYAKKALELGIGIVNGIPTLISHNESMVDLAKKNNTVIIGDDFKSQIGGTILHNTLLRLLKERGIKINESYQINYAGNMDFLNLQTSRGDEKHESKKRGATAGYEDLEISVNVSYLENQDDNKTCRIWIEGENFSQCPVSLECKLTVVDSANSSGVIVDAVRCAYIAKSKKLFGYLSAPSAYYMKSPNAQMKNEEAMQLIEELISI